jgi:hypothetical protein
MDHQPGWSLMALVKSSEGDVNFRNDSIEFGQHEKKEKKVRRGGGSEDYIA